MKNRGLGVRKGVWIEQEDALLRKCVQEYGEGKWHLVPRRAGLNRCRKSCRLRWLNYLRPNIKRGDFESDEVDLIIRLHKLLGNRWSLIAGRLPDRTANDVKNYWNTHIKKKLTLPKEQKITRATIIRPQPRTFNKNLHWFRPKTPQSAANNIQPGYLNFSNPPPISPFAVTDQGSLQWLDDLFVDKEPCETLSVSVSEHQQHVNVSSSNQSSLAETDSGGNSWSDLSIDIDIWDLLNSD